MPTIIDSLLVTLGLDTKGFQKGSKEVEASFKKTKSGAKQTGKDIEQAGKQGSEFFKQLEKSAVKFFSVLTVGRGIGDFVSNVIGTGAALDRMSTRLGISASELSRWQGAIRQSGGTAEGALATFQNLSDQLTQLQLTGDAPIKQLLANLGVAAVDASGKAKGIPTLIRDIASAMESRGWSNADKFNFAKMAGLDEGTLNLIMRGRDEMEKLLASQREYNDDDAKAARIASEKWELAKQRMEKLTQQLVFLLLPAFDATVKVIELASEAFIGFSSKNIKGWGVIYDWTKKWVDLLLKAVDALEKITGIDFGGAIKKGLSGNPLVRAASLIGDLFGEEDSKSSAPAKSRVSSGRVGDETAPISYDMANKLAAAEKANGLPAGLLSSIMKQETGNRKDFQDDPAKYHYEKDANGKRKSSAFGLFGILDSTAKDPGYGIDPLKDKSVAEQIRFAAQYSAARIKAAGGDVAKGMAGYGEGSKYADQVMSRLPGGAMTGLQLTGMNSGGGGSTVSIGEVKVYTQATDANGIARDLGAALVRQADTGMR